MHKTNPQRFVIEVTTTTAGAATVYSPLIYGAVWQIHYIKAGSGGFSDGVDFAITAEQTGQGLWTEDNVNASKVVAPRQASHNQVGSAQSALVPIVLGNDRVKIVITNGGSETDGTFVVVAG